MKPADANASLYVVPFTEIATELGTSLMKNMVAIGASCAVLEWIRKYLVKWLMKYLAVKEEVVEKNMDAIAAGYEYMKKELGAHVGVMQLEKADGKKRLFMIGNDAIALGAFAGGCSLYGSLSNYSSF